MLITHSDIAILCTLEETSVEPPSLEQTKQGAANSRLASYSGVGVLAICACGYLQRSDWQSRLLAAWLLLELWFMVYQKARYEILNTQVDVSLDLQRICQVKQRFLKLHGIFEIEAFLSGWFNGAPLAAIKRGNVEEFVAYGFYTRSLSSLPAEAQQQVRTFVSEVQRIWGVKLPPGFDPSVTFMAHLWEPLRVIPLPLALHVLSEAMHLVCRSLLALAGFSVHYMHGLKYWLLEPRQGDDSPYLDGRHPGSAESPAVPVIFLHGVGLGVLPYVRLLQRIHAECPDSPLLVFDLPAVSLRLCQRAPDVDDIARAAVAAQELHFGSQRAMFAAHSFGTFCVSRVCQLFPGAVHSLALMDPVCMLTCYPQLLRNFVYKLPTLRESVGSILGFANAIRWVLARDLVIAETFCRKFLWHSLMLWPEDMPSAAVIAAGCEDDLVPARMVAQHLQAAQSGAVVMLHPTAGHGGFLVDSTFQDQLVRHIGRLLRNGSCHKQS